MRRRNTWFFSKGSPGSVKFFYGGKELVKCNEFSYLGVVMTPKLSSQKHIDSVLSKAEARIGFLFSQLPLKEIPLPVVLQLFDTYVFPLISYAVSVWLPSSTETGVCEVNAIYTKFLKRYLGIPYGSSNANVHFISGTVPLDVRLAMSSQKSFLKLCFPISLNGVQIRPPPNPEFIVSTYNAYEDIPSFFWMSPVIEKLPLNSSSRRALLYEVMDLYHFHLCIDGNTACSKKKPDSRFCGHNFCPIWNLIVSFESSIINLGLCQIFL